jgi:hypothetical protein
MASPEYVPRLEMLTVGSLIDLIKTIELNPIYQRKIVWFFTNKYIFVSKKLL